MTEAESSGKFEPTNKLRKVGRHIKNLISRRSQISQEQNPDRPHPQEHLIRHPQGGEVPIKELLDQAHQRIRADEIIDQDRNPQPEPILLSEKEIPQHAFELVMELQDAVSQWNVAKETDLEDGKMLRDYNTTQDTVPDEKIFFRGQLIYPDRTSKTPSYGNLSIVKFPVRKWPREYYFQAKPAAEKPGDKPLIYYDDFPYHEEELGRPEKNSVGAFQKAKELIAQLPKTT